MKITVIKFTKRITTKQYEWEEFGAEADIKEFENELESGQNLISYVESMLERKQKVEKVEAVVVVEAPPVAEKIPVDVKPVEEKPKRVSSKEKGPKEKSKPSLSTPYDRDVVLHKTIFTKILFELHPGWNENEALKTKAKNASTSLVGKDFLDPQGEVIPSFKELVASAMN